MFEKSLVDLIRGMRGHKGREAEYIQSAIRECRTEIKSQDMDVKATALLKLIYLEMFGNEITWAAFNVLEVMSSSKHMQKRVGYLAAVQTFRPETEILMLAENLLKKDLTSPSIPTLTLPLVTLPHIVSSSLALSILTDLLPRLSHSQPMVRKKTITTLYRLALIHPETLRVAWPKIKERLLDGNEDGSVIATAVNVVCELGWRRPHDFLPLAPRLFELLVDGGNNWMAIKIIKLFAVLTPLEPRLVKKLVRPLTNLIQTTTAMSLLYECVNGIVQGGILSSTDSGVDVSEVADLCISKLRGMVIVEGDPNLKYVALLAFNKIVDSHPVLVARQSDVILRCLDDPDVTIRLQALDLASGMVSSHNLQSMVDRLMRQLATATAQRQDHSIQDDDADMETKLVKDKRGSEMSALPSKYRIDIITKIIDMCSANNYGYISDFEWYIQILVNLIKQLPPSSMNSNDEENNTSALALRIGHQLLDISIRVRDLRLEVVHAVESLVLVNTRNSLFSAHNTGQDEILRSVVWLCGEFSQYINSPYEVLNSLTHSSVREMTAKTITVFLQAIPKVFSRFSRDMSKEWNHSRKSTTELTLRRVIAFLDELSTHPGLEVQERATEFVELLKLCAEALELQGSDSSQAPLLLVEIIPNLFKGEDMKPVALTAQGRVPLPDDLDLDKTIRQNLSDILQASQLTDVNVHVDDDDAAFDTFYHEREIAKEKEMLPSHPVHEGGQAESYQAMPNSLRTMRRRQAERETRARDDPFYIANDGAAPDDDASNIIRRDQEDLNVDEIPVINLHLDAEQLSYKQESATTTKKKPKKRLVVAADENLDYPSQLSSSYTGEKRLSRPISRALSAQSSPSSSVPARKTRNNILSVDSTNLGSLNLDDTALLAQNHSGPEQHLTEDAEMAAALKEIESKRLELARQEERAQTQIADGIENDDVVVKRKKKKSKKSELTKDGVGALEGDNVAKKKKKKRPKKDTGIGTPNDEGGIIIDMSNT